MGIDAVKTTLQNAGFRVDTGYPADRAVHIGATVAAVNLTGVDSNGRNAGITVSVLTPRKLGLDQCQSAAASVVAALSADGGGWQFEGFQYDSAADCYCIAVTGALPVRLEDGDWVQPDALEVLIGESAVEYVTDLTATRQMNRRLIRPTIQREPIGVTPGTGGWIIKLTQVLPAGIKEPESGEESFTLTVRRGTGSVVYAGCCWSEHSSVYRSGGTTVVRSGLALSREVK